MEGVRRVRSWSFRRKSFQNSHRTPVVDSQCDVSSPPSWNCLSPQEDDSKRRTSKKLQRRKSKHSHSTLACVS